MKKRNLIIVSGKRCSGKSTLVGMLTEGENFEMFTYSKKVVSIIKKALLENFMQRNVQKGVVIECSPEQLENLQEQLWVTYLPCKTIFIIVATEDVIPVQIPVFPEFKVSIVQTQFIDNYR